MVNVCDFCEQVGVRSVVKLQFSLEPQRRLWLFVQLVYLDEQHSLTVLQVLFLQGMQCYILNLMSNYYHNNIM